MYKKSLFLGLILLAIFLIALPKIISTKPFIVPIIQKTLKEKGNCEFENLTLSWFGPQKIEKLKLTGKDAEIYIDSFSTSSSLIGIYISLEHSFKTPFEIRGSNLKLISSNTELRNVNASLKDEKLQVEGQTKEADVIGDFNIEASIKDETYTIRGKNIPVVAIDKLLTLSNYSYLTPLHSLLGDKVSFTVSGKDKIGPLFVNLESSKATLNLAAILEREGFKLSRPSEMTLLVDEEAQNYLGERISNFPNFISKRPLYLFVNDNNFYCSYDFKKMNIERATLDPSQIVLKESAVIAPLMDFIKDKSSELYLWFTPIDFSYTNQILNLDRLDVLINNRYQIRLWGKADLVLQEVDMILGLTAQALYALFGIENVSEDFVVQVPLKGSFNHIKADTKEAKEQITSMATAQIAERAAGAMSGNSAFGSILGSIAKSKPMKNSRPTPEPKRPFPWGDRIEHSKPSKSSDPTQFFKMF